MQRIFNIISVLAFLLVAAITGGGVLGYLWITNEDNQKMLQDKAMEKVMGAIKIPGLSGPALPTGPLTPEQQKNEEKKAIGVPFMPINHIESFCECEDQNVFGESFKQVF